jgi:FkbM family methyltransferase
MNAAIADEGRFFAQFGEDEILAALFGGRTGGTCLEVGGHDGVTGSNTLRFERLGWRCVIVEPVPALADAIRRQRTCVVAECAASSAEGVACLQVADGAESMSSLRPSPEHARRVAELGGRWTPLRVRTRTLDSILAEAGIEELDFITIDVEGHELEVLRGFSLATFRPRVVIVEAGEESAAAAVSAHLADGGYSYFLRTVVNHWYARPEFLASVDLHAARRLARAREREIRFAAWLRPLSRFLPLPVRLAALRALRPLLVLGRGRGAGADGPVRGASPRDPEDPCPPPC